MTTATRKPSRRTPPAPIGRNDVHPAVVNLLGVAARFGVADAAQLYCLGNGYGEDWSALADALVVMAAPGRARDAVHQAARSMRAAIA